MFANFTNSTSVHFKGDISTADFLFLLTLMGIAISFLMAIGFCLYKCAKRC